MPNKNKRKLDTPMVEKVSVVENESENMTSMIVGTVLVAFGILLFVVGIVMLVLYYLPPREDVNVSKPILYELPKTTNSAKLVIKGESDYEKVMIWVNGELVNGELEVENKYFEMEYPITKEGEYNVQAASLKGFPIRLKSELTSPMSVLIDWTAPSKNIALKYEKEVDRRVFSVTGKGEANTTVTLKNGSREYSAKTDSKGEFAIKDVPLREGRNEFTVVVSDLAGNSARLDSLVKVLYAMGDINGGGVKDLPEASGIFSNEYAYNAGNSLMYIFGILATLVFTINMYVVKRKLNSIS